MLNRFKNMVVLSDDSAESLVEQIKRIPYEFSIKAMYGLNGHHYAYLVVDRPVKVVKKKRTTRKVKTVEDIQKDLNLKET